MEALSLIIFHNDPRTAQALVVSLSEHFGPVNLVRRYEEIRSAIARHRASVLVLDLEALDREASGARAVGDLHREFPSLRIVATHRLADDQVWTEAMNQGAADVCEPRNVEVVRAVMRERAHCAAAAA
jgi:DNA-binding NtrC family response regulator